MLSRLDFAVIVACVVGGALWIEQSHRIVIDAPTRTENTIPAAQPACPDNDNVPYSERCIIFLGSRFAYGMNWQANAAAGPAGAPAYAPN